MTGGPGRSQPVPERAPPSINPGHVADPAREPGVLQHTLTFLGIMIVMGLILWG